MGFHKPSDPCIYCPSCHADKSRTSDRTDGEM